MIDIETKFNSVTEQIQRCAQLAGQPVNLLAVSKSKSADQIKQLHACGQRDFGENYVQEALEKMALLPNLDLHWHFIGPLQSNKCKAVARNFDWCQSVDREKLVHGLASSRGNDLAPLNVLVQVNIDDESSKSGVAPSNAINLCNLIGQYQQLKLRGLMAIPRPAAEPEQRRKSFRAMAQLFTQLRQTMPQMDTLSMGMSDDFAIAIDEGATMIRIGTALFGSRNN